MIKIASKRYVQKLIRRIKNKKREYGKNRYRNMSEQKKKRLKEHQKKLS